MFRTSYIKVYILPVMICLLRNQRFIVMRIHVTQIICTGTGKSRHGIQFQREYIHVINLRIFYDFTFGYIPCPTGCMSQRRFSTFCRQELSNLRKFQRKLAFVNHIRHAVLVIYRERFTPITLARENRITQTEVDFHTAQIMLFHIFLGSCNGFFNCQAIQRQLAIRSYPGFRRVANDSFLRIEAFFAYVTTFYQRYNRQVEMFGKCIVTTIVRRYRHDGSCSITSQYIITNPYWNRFSCKRIYGIRTTEHTRYTTVCNTFTFCTLLCTVQISLNFCTLCFGCQHRHQFTFRCKYHESHTEHRIGTRSKDSKFQIAVFYLETYFSTF